MKGPTRALTPPEALNRIRSGQISPFYLLAGPDTHAGSKLVEAIKRALLHGAEGGTVDFSTVDCQKGGSLAAAVAEALTPPFFSPKRLVVVLEPELSREREAEKLLEYMGDPPDTGCLVVRTTGGAEGSTVMRAAEKTGTLVRCGLPSPEQLARWSAARAREAGKKLGRAAARLLAERSQNDPWKCENELQKLIAYAGERDEITEEDVELLTPSVPEHKTFAILDSVAAGDAACAGRLARELLDSNESVAALLSMLGNHLLRLARARTMLDSGIPPDRCVPAMGIHPYAARVCVGQASRLQMETLRFSILATLEAEAAVKSGSLDERTAFECLVSRLCSRINASRREPPA